MTVNCLRLNMEVGKFTWEKSRGSDAWVREKLDHGFASISWWSKFPFYNLRVLHTSVSDHEPLLLNFYKVETSKKSFRFRFENVWLREPTFVNEVKEMWAALPNIHLLFKLLEVSSFIARWGRTFFHKFRENVKQQKANLDRLVDRTDA
ncbi:uncharacterized protein LOC141701530 [Apium graveolens]|uniref:uncharacterized protein LOC141701530 n=1 Tax=Apium graveolens TaxID=4045 RepID=UPI003D7C101D